MRDLENIHSPDSVSAEQFQLTPLFHIARQQKTVFAESGLEDEGAVIAADRPPAWEAAGGWRPR